MRDLCRKASSGEGILQVRRFSSSIITATDILYQWYSTCGTRTLGGTRRHLRRYSKTSYIDQNEAHDQLEL
jgi:hypothetical protein